MLSRIARFLFCISYLESAVLSRPSSHEANGGVRGVNSARVKECEPNVGTFGVGKSFGMKLTSHHDPH